MVRRIAGRFEGISEEEISVVWSLRESQRRMEVLCGFSDTVVAALSTFSTILCRRRFFPRTHTKKTKQ